ncbi:CinA family protein [Aurantiacibacter poecillastricola]|uniref:CinA family protein n=1 Tax=Aurantiacibacter poecillastricola TaxID=3064385 RepID=UPI00273F0553|nr:CinA family protein [Aurantiacibacter sp. 219JJ12-13]MDP5261678.1 CinA family protein [Aurantiacibacter sp. 219JJ12-13]
MAETLGPALPHDLQDKARNVLEKACKARTPIAVAESCTGGLLSALLTDIPGCSHIFERGFVTYSDQAKCDLLGVDRAIVDDCGAVSREVAIAMARGALDRAEADLALSITGFAGPPGEGDDGEEGLVHFACCSKGGSMTHLECHYGKEGRQGVRIAALNTALNLLEQEIGALA